MSLSCFWKYSLQHSQGRLLDIVQLSWQADDVQLLQGKGYLDNDKEMRIFLPHPAPHCLRKDASVCMALPGGQIGPIRARVHVEKFS